MPNISFEVLANSPDGNQGARKDLAGIMRKYRADILHIHYVSFLTHYSWGARFDLPDRCSLLIITRDRRARFNLERRCGSAPRLLNQPPNKVVCVSNYGYGCMTATDVLPRTRFQMIYKGVDFRVSAPIRSWRSN